MKILMINHKATQCGVADYGIRLYDILKSYIPMLFAEVSNLDQYRAAVKAADPEIILYNYHYATITFLNDSVIDKSIKHVAIFHEAGLNFTPDRVIDTSIRPLFNFEAIWHNRSNIPIIGSFGFGFPDKNFPAIAQRVKEQFTHAIVRLNIPFADYGDRDGYLARQEADKVREVLKGTDIELLVSHDYLSQTDLLDFLNENDINLFLYKQSNGRGLASCTDYALSVHKPLGVSDSEMFRHLPAELQNTDIRWLIDNYSEITKPVYEKHSHKRLVERFKELLTL